jgi:sugar phosphate isomerase/epimerase
VADELGLNRVQFTATMLDPRWPKRYVMKQAEKIRGLCDKKGIRILATFTDAYSRQNHVTSPDPELRRYWVDWFKRLTDIGAVLGAEGVGGHFGILSVRDNSDPERRKAMLLEGCRNWAEIAAYAATKGHKYVYFEPMSIPREFAHTIAETKITLDLVNRNIALPMLLCLDVDHGDLESENPDDTDPYRWLEEFATCSPIIHLKQSLADKGGHYPFTAAYNARGKVRPDKVLDTLVRVGATNAALVFEFSHRERWPTEYSVIPDFKESIAYWRVALTRLQARSEAAR